MKKPLWLIKLKFEYWPWWLLYLLLTPVLLWQMLRTRSATFFTTLNPGMDDTSGFSGTSKSQIMAHFPEKFRPATLLVPAEAPPTVVLQEMDTMGIVFPIIIKPDAGERGIGVQKILSAEALTKFMAAHRYLFQIQEFVTLPLEFAVFYVRYPGQANGRVLSVTAKQFLSVTGDGRSTIGQLMQQSDRARLQIARFMAENPALLGEVLPAGETRQLEPIGNHNRGTAFLDASHLISPAMHRAFDQLADHFPGFCYGRYDLKVQSEEDLTTFNQLKIIELNGAHAEPVHIYDPNGNWWKAYKTMATLWSVAGDIAILQMKLGVVPMKFFPLLNRVQNHVENRDK